MKKLSQKEIKKLQPGDPVVTNLGCATYVGYCKKTYAHKVKMSDTGESKNAYSLYKSA